MKSQNDNKMIVIYNFKQACAYIKNNVQPVKVKYGKKGDLAFYFNLEDTKEVWEKWKNKEDMFN